MIGGNLTVMINKKQNGALMKKHLFALALLPLWAALAVCQTAITDMEVTYTQDFNTLDTISTANMTWTDNSTLPAWYSNRYTYRGDNGSSNAGGLKSYGAFGSTERALGFLSSSSASPKAGWRLVNSTGDIIQSLQVSVRMEQWRQGNYTTPPTRRDTVLFRYQVAATVTNCTTGTWTEVPQLMLQAVDTQLAATAGVAQNGNDPLHQANVSYRFNVTIPDGQEIMITWADTNNYGGDAGMAIDDVSVTAYNVTGVAGAPDGAAASFRLLPARPNPARDGTVIAYSLARAGTVSLRVFNMLGQQVATLASGPQPAGSHQARWSLRSDQGAPVPNGVYFFQLEAGGRSDTRKLIVVR